MCNPIPHNVSDFIPPQTSLSNKKDTLLKPPRLVLDHIFAFPPNRETLGGTAYLIVENTANILIDCPLWNPTNEQFLREQGGVSTLFITHRGGISRAREIQEAMGCKIIIQEQEAYLLPGIDTTPFQQEFILTPNCYAIWTPGHSPGSACLYYNSSSSGGVLFSGRHLLPNPQGEIMPQRTSKTFHWHRQIRSIKSLLERFTPATLEFICPGANTGFLRGKGFIDQAYQRLSGLDLTT